MKKKHQKCDILDQTGKKAWNRKTIRVGKCYNNKIIMKKVILKSTLAVVAVVASIYGAWKAYDTYSWEPSETDLLFVENLTAFSESYDHCTIGTQDCHYNLYGKPNKTAIINIFGFGKRKITFNNEGFYDCVLEKYHITCYDGGTKLCSPQYCPNSLNVTIIYE